MQLLIKQFRGANVGAIAVGTTPLAYKQELQFIESVDSIRIGLDFNKNYIDSKMQQLSCFRRISEKCAVEGEKVLSIHSVKATGAVICTLKEAGTFKICKCIFHWFTGTVSERKAAIENGAYFSINPKMIK